MYDVLDEEDKVAFEEFSNKETDIYIKYKNNIDSYLGGLTMDAFSWWVSPHHMTRKAAERKLRRILSEMFQMPDEAIDKYFEYAKGSCHYVEITKVLSGEWQGEMTMKKKDGTYKTYKSPE